MAKTLFHFFSKSILISIKEGLYKMTFYHPLTPYYDEIFPTNLKALHFLADTFQQGGTLLDVGAGTGNMALALLNKGFKVTATEPEEAMANQIRQKAKEHTNPLKVFTKTMQQLDEFVETFDGIYCIGNTLVHLHNLEEIDEFLHQSYKRLHHNGALIFQIVNFERVLTKQDFTFPVIKKETFEFKRHYELVDEKIRFTTTLLTNDQSIANTTLLYPATLKQLLPLLERCGFRAIETYGNFEKSRYSVNSPACIVVARK